MSSTSKGEHARVETLVSVDLCTQAESDPPLTVNFESLDLVGVGILVVNLDSVTSFLLYTHNML